jgi:hypothetical protein
MGSGDDGLPDRLLDTTHGIYCGPGQATVLIVVDEQLPGPTGRLRPGPTRYQLRAWDSHHEAGATSLTLHPICGGFLRMSQLDPYNGGVRMPVVVATRGQQRWCYVKTYLRHDCDGSDS